MANKKINGRKGAISSVIVDFGAYVAFVLVIIIFYALFTYQAKDVSENKITGFKSDSKYGSYFTAYLNTPYTLNNEKITIGEMITLYYNEKDASKKEEYYEKIVKKTKDIFDPLEHCVPIEGLKDKAVVGYAVFILDEGSYNTQSEFVKEYVGTSLKTDKKFRSGHFKEGRIEEKHLGVIPNVNSGDVIYLGFFMSSINTFGEDILNVRDCKNEE